MLLLIVMCVMILWLVSDGNIGLGNFGLCVVCLVVMIVFMLLVKFLRKVGRLFIFMLLWCVWISMVVNLVSWVLL